jgi:acyl-CoA dehydrogenase
MGLTNDTPLAFLFTWGRAMRFIDGPDEVHLRTIARQEFRRARDHLGAAAAYLTPPPEAG